MKVVLRRFGNSKGVIIPAPFLKELAVEEDAKLNMKVEGKKIVLEPVSQLEFTCEELLEISSKSALYLRESSLDWSLCWQQEKKVMR